MKKALLKVVSLLFVINLMFNSFSCKHTERQVKQEDSEKLKEMPKPGVQDEAKTDSLKRALDKKREEKRLQKQK